MSNPYEKIEALEREPFVDAIECAAALRISPAFLRRMARKGRVPCYDASMGSRMNPRFRISQVEKALEGKRTA